MKKPEQRNSETQLVERSWSIPAPLSIAATKGAQQPGTQVVKPAVKQREQENLREQSGAFFRCCQWTSLGLSKASSDLLSRMVISTCQRRA